MVTELAAFSNAPYGVLICKPDYTIVGMNKEAMRIFCCKCHADFLQAQRKLPDLIGSSDAWASMRNTLNSHRVLRDVEVCISQQRGCSLWLQINAHFVDPTRKRSDIIFQCQDITSQKSRDQQLLRMATTDALTGLYNRYSFNKLAANRIAEAKRYGEKLAILFMDINSFKSINDAYGHSFGDKVLTQVANRLAIRARHSDICARFGGDEFCILVGGILSIDDADIVAKGISAAVARPMVIEDRTILAQVSIGISIFPKNAKNLDSLIEDADKNMYAIKRGAISSYMASPLYRCSPMLKAHSRLIPKDDRLLPLDTRASKVVRAMEVR